MKRLWPILALAITVLVVASCERRELWVFTYSKVGLRLEVDWSHFSERPTGMTAIFYPHEEGRTPTAITTASIEGTDLQLQEGTYDVLLFNQSVAEFSNQSFRNMGSLPESEVYLLPLLQQPNVRGALSVLFSDNEEVLEQPELMAIDTLMNVVVTEQNGRGLILYRNRDQAGTEYLGTDVLRMTPHEIVWTLNIYVYCYGIQNVASVNGSIRGMSAGYFLGQDHRTPESATHRIDGWTQQLLNDSTGYITISMRTFGRIWKDNLPYLPEDVDLNLLFNLRDGKTTRDYHYPVGSAIRVEDPVARILVLLIDANTFPNLPDLPDVPDQRESDANGFDADVSPWENGGEVDVGL